MKITPKGFAQMTRFLKEAAETYSGGNIIFILEGGYSLEGLWLSTREVVEELIEKKKTGYPTTGLKTSADSIIADVKSTHSQYWKF
jgi:acetoin utilization deacetylase AcuC-like enzyme